MGKIMASYVLSILITILTDVWKLKLFTAILVTSIQDGAAEFLKIFVSFLIDAKTGNFWMLVYSTAIYSLGLGILKYSYPQFSTEEVNACVNNGVCPPKTLTFTFYVALLLVTTGKSGHEFSLEGFSPTGEIIEAQDEEEKSTKSSQEAQVITQEMKPRKHDKIVWYAITIVATLFASLGVPYIISTWSQTLALSAITMGFSILPLLLATLFYIPRKRIGSPLTHVFHVMFVIDCCPGHDNNDSSPSTRVQTPIGFTSDPRSSGPRSCTKQHVDEVKHLRKMIPMSLTFFM